MPKDPVMLLSYVNTQLRDFYPSLQELCSSLQVSEYDCGTGWQRLIMNMMQ